MRIIIKQSILLLLIWCCTWVLFAQKPALISPYDITSDGNIKKADPTQIIKKFFPTGEKLLINGKYREALGKFLGAIENNEPQVPVYFNLACTFAMSGKYKKAIAFFQKAEAKMDTIKKPFAYFNIASCLLMIFVQNPDKNIKSLKKAESFYKKAAFNLPYFSTPGQLKKLVFTWMDLFDNNSLSNYILAFKKTTIFPDSYTAIKEKNIKEVGNKIDIQIHKDSIPLLFYYDSPVMKFFIANSFLGRKLYNKADVFIQDALKSSENYFDHPFYLKIKGLLLLTIADSQFNSGNYDQALGNNQKASIILTDDIRTSKLHLKIYLKKRNYAKVIEYAKKIILKDPGNTQARKLTKLVLEMPEIKKGVCFLNNYGISYKFPENWIPFNTDTNYNFFADILKKPSLSKLKIGFSRSLNPESPNVYIEVGENELYTPDEKANKEYTKEEIYKDFQIMLDNEFEDMIKMDPSFQVIVAAKTRKIGSIDFIEYITLTEKSYMTFFYFIPTKKTVVSLTAKMTRKDSMDLKFVLEKSLQDFIKK